MYKLRITKQLKYFDEVIRLLKKTVRREIGDTTKRKNISIACMHFPSLAFIE